MWQALAHTNPGAQSSTVLSAATPQALPLALLKEEETDRELEHLCSMHFTQDEQDYLELALSQERLRRLPLGVPLSAPFHRRAVGEQLEGCRPRPTGARHGLRDLFVLYIINELWQPPPGDVRNPSRPPQQPLPRQGTRVPQS